MLEKATWEAPTSDIANDTAPTSARTNRYGRSVDHGMGSGCADAHAGRAKPFR